MEKSGKYGNMKSLESGKYALKIDYMSFEIIDNPLFVKYYIIFANKFLIRFYKLYPIFCLSANIYNQCLGHPKMYWLR